MKNITSLLVCLLLAFWGCHKTEPVQPENKYYARQVGLIAFDTTSYWKYDCYYKDSTGIYYYTREEEILDTATINGMPAYKILITQNNIYQSSFKIRIDSAGITYVNSQNNKYHYRYPSSDTFVINQSGNRILYGLIMPKDTVILGYDDLILYKVWYNDNPQSQTFNYYKYAFGLVYSLTVSPTDTIVHSLVDYH